ncbi:MAG: hypothetical protein KTR32_07605 [Granulosicoccus sp.]|nr:hypothetical protein [Granulosicoccus sp.]
MSFERHFTDSIAFRSHFDELFSIEDVGRKKLEATFRKTSNQAMQEPFFSLRQQLCSLATAYDLQSTSDPFTYQCLADSHVFLQACIEQKLVNQKYMTLTVGDVSFRGMRLFNTTRSIMREVVAHGISTQDEPRFHVWLTLADMTIIDFGILTHLHKHALLPELPEAGQQVNFWRTQRKGEFDYHPVLVDDEFLSRLQRPLQ